jgi:hypothetical protein
MLLLINAIKVNLNNIINFSNTLKGSLLMPKKMFNKLGIIKKNA